MNRFVFFIVILYSFFGFGFSQEYNLNFEKVSDKQGLPDGWGRWGALTYDIKLDSLIKHSGKYSLRIESQTDEIVKGEFGCPRYSIPVDFAGKTVTVKAIMKLEDVENPIGLLLRIDGSTGTLQINNMQRMGVKGTHDWKEYSVTLPLPKEAETINIGAIHSGNGKLWVDNFQLLIDGKDLSKAKPKIKSKAEEDTEFNSGSKIYLDDYTPQMLSNLEILCRVWGFLKYYHPEIASGNYNWDAELFRIMPKIIDVTNKDDFNRILLQWVNKLDKVSIKEVKDKLPIKLQPDLKWINSETLGTELTEKLLKIKDAKRSEDNFYVSMFPGLPTPNFKNENGYSSMKFDDAGFRLLALFRYWNMIQYFYPYRHLTDKDWNVVLSEFIPKFLNSKSEKDYKLIVLQLIAQVCDSHAGFYDRTLAEIKGLKMAPYNTLFIEEKPVIIERLSDDTILHKGDIIVSIDKRPIEEIIKEKIPYTPASNYPRQLELIARELLHTNSEFLTLGIKRGDQELTCVVKCLDVNSLPQKEPGEGRYKIISGIGYIPGNIRRDSLLKIIETLPNTKGLIVDFRLFPDGDINHITSIIDFLTPEKMEFAQITTGSVTTPGKFVFTPPFQFAFVKLKMVVGKRNKDIYKGRVIVLVNENTISAAEFATMAFQIAPQVIVIGSTTAGADGNVTGTIVLPGGIRTQVTGIGIYYPDGRETQRVGVAIDKEIKPTLRGIIEGRDELLEQAIKMIENE